MLTVEATCVDQSSGCLGAQLSHALRSHMEVFGAAMLFQLFHAKKKLWVSAFTKLKVSAKKSNSTQTVFHKQNRWVEEVSFRFRNNWSHFGTLLIHASNEF